jgi:hypothetical protein
VELLKLWLEQLIAQEETIKSWAGSLLEYRGLNSS